MTRLESMAQLYQPRRLAGWLHKLKERTKDSNNALRSVAHHLLSRPVDHDELETVIRMHISRGEAGAVTTCGFLARTAPLIGLAGTLVGVRQALAAFARNASQSKLAISGFSTALESTLVGIGIAFLCLATARLVWEPCLKAKMLRLLDFTITAKGYLTELRGRLGGPHPRTAGPSQRPPRRHREVMPPPRPAGPPKGARHDALPPQRPQDNNPNADSEGS